MSAVPKGCKMIKRTNVERGVCPRGGREGGGGGGRAEPSSAEAPSPEAAELSASLATAPNTLSGENLKAQTVSVLIYTFSSGVWD